MLRQIIPFLIGILLLLGGCAKVVTPVGGPKDTTPPKVIKEQPAKQSVNFSEKKIIITMDEYFTLNNTTSNVLVSPPFKHAAEYSTKGKNLIIKIKDTLRENATYNIVFSNCIQDYNEGNVLSLYHYSFSTGSYIDSCMLRGRVQHAQTQEKGEDYVVMLYLQEADSLPLTTLPDYITKTNKEGQFSFENITDGDYKIFALKDINGNYLYDLPNESIAYLDQRVLSYPAPTKDSTGQTVADTLHNDLLLYSFEVQDSVPKLMRYENPEAGLYRFPFSKAVQHLEVVPLSEGPSYFQIWNTHRDTLIWYFKSLDFDSLKYQFTADGKRDTVFLKSYKSMSGGSSSGRGSSSRKSVPSLSTKFLNEGDCYKPLTLHFGYPIQPTDTFVAILQSKNDTVLVPLAVPDTLVMDLPIPLSLETKKSYTFILPDSIFTGYNGLSHDTLKSSFTYKSEKEYGNIILHYSLDSAITYPIIVRLMSGTKLVQEDMLTHDVTITYAHLTPATYQIIFIHDKNGNGLWDSGDYRRKVQPELTETFEKNISVRAFWDVEESAFIELDSRLH